MLEFTSSSCSHRVGTSQFLKWPCKGGFSTLHGNSRGRTRPLLLNSSLEVYPPYIPGHHPPPLHFNFDACNSRSGSSCSLCCRPQAEIILLVSSKSEHSPLQGVNWI